MYCAKCGHELPDDANFCLKCGKPQKESASHSLEAEILYETCEIIVKDAPKAGIFNNSVILKAKAVGPNGVDYVGESALVIGEWNSVYKYNMPKSSSKTSREIEKLRSKLLSEGWEPTGQRAPGAFWSHTFKRQIKKTS